MVTKTISPELQIRKLPYRISKELSEILDIPGPRDWKALIAELPDGTYTRGQIAMFERESYRPGASSSLALLTDLGHQLMTVEQLTTYLQAIGNHEALLLLKPHEPVFIKTHPFSEIVQENESCTLVCEATGFPLPRFQWFKNNSLIPGVSTKELQFKKITIADAGEYYCKVENPMGSDISMLATIQVIPATVWIDKGVTANSDFESIGRLMANVSIDEETVPMVPGQHFVLNCDTNAQFLQWYKNGYKIPGACQAQLVFQMFRPADEGRYSCKATDHRGVEIITKAANLKINPGLIPPNIPQTPTIPPTSPVIDSKGAIPKSPEFATGKLALIIANQKYQYPRSENEQLVHPFDDAKLLQASLENIDFKVITLLNLTKREMEAAIDGFCNLLKCSEGLYSLFYFCGHGFEDHGKTFLVPVDASRQWTPDAALSAEYILSKIQHCQTTKLDVLLLDVCRIPSGNGKSMESLSSFDPPFKPGSQCVFGYATCPQSQAFEIRRDRNGIYMKHLAKKIIDNVQVENLLHNVGVEVRKEAEHHQLTSTMSPTFKSTTTKHFSLADPVFSDGRLSKTEKDLTQEWFAYHRLPALQSINFDHGIVIDIKFLPVCSNVCNVVIHVASMGLTRCCDAKIIEISDDLDVPNSSMNMEISLTQEYIPKSFKFDSMSDDTSSERSAEIERWTQVSALQKLTGPFAMTVEVVYQHHDTEGIHRQFKKQIFRNDEFGIVSFFNS